MTEAMVKKLVLLAAAAKYDVSCASSGTTRRGRAGGPGSASGWGVCHSFAGDGRCIALLKVLYTNMCRYDCAYCVNRRSNDIPRASFEARELAELTIEFYRRNYIEGLFLSSGVPHDPDQTMERLVQVARELRRRHRFNGYIHLKAIPGSSPELLRQAGLFADRLSVNVEIPAEAELRRLAPEKNHQSVYAPMRHIRLGILENEQDRKKFRHAPSFAPAGQSTQMIIGAGREADLEVLRLASFLYQGLDLKRVYYSGFIPVNSHDPRLPALKEPPLVRENRLYQADWLMRFYAFSAEEILDRSSLNLDQDIDPKLAWALRHPEYFPLDVNRADYVQILRVPGIGLKSAQRIVAARRHARLNAGHLKRLGVVLKRAQYFLINQESPVLTIQEAGPARVRAALAPQSAGRPRQLSLWN
ncbi:MAG: putative DNA modification/repair radical SAM protein [Deltaproteobacteria bacterium]|jgi:putative DNA modification/repair radical SAM protein|nr:putative DNA modification/repair radical SAM protein [Deltaproteobacteria bacterium]